MTNYCIFMPTTIEIDKNSRLYLINQLTPNEIREKHYVDGIKKFYEFNKDKNIDIYISDNSDYFNKDSELKKYIDTTTIQIVQDIPNNYGKFNKGSGLIENYLYNKYILNKYDYLIHFEPRQLLQSNQFIDNFLENPRNLFTYGGAYIYKDSNSLRHFNTGLFCIKTSILINFIEKINLTNFNESIEYTIFNYFKDNNINFDILEKLDLFWFPNNSQKLYF